MLNEEIIEEMLNDEFFVKVIKALILLNIIIIVVAIVMFFWNIMDGRDPFNGWFLCDIFGIDMKEN